MSRDFSRNRANGMKISTRRRIFKVVNLDPDEMLVRIHWLDGEYEDLDLEAWNELDLEKAEEPEGWVNEGEEDEDEDDLDDEEDDDEDEDD